MYNQWWKLHHIKAEITEDNLLVALKSIPYNKTPRNDGLSKEFYETFWEGIKGVFINSLKQAKIVGSLSISRRQAVIKLLEKKVKIKDTYKTGDLFLYSILIQK